MILCKKNHMKNTETVWRDCWVESFPFRIHLTDDWLVDCVWYCVGYKKRKERKTHPVSSSSGHLGHKCLTILFSGAQAPLFSWSIVEHGNVLEWLKLRFSKQHPFFKGTILYIGLCVRACACLCGPHMSTCIHGEVKSVNKVDSLHWCQPTRHHHDN